MKFTESPVIELSVRGSVLSLQQDNGSMHVGTSVWPCSLVLVKFVERWAPPLPSDSDLNTPNPYSDLLDFRSKRAVEIGTGCGVSGMGLYLLGLTDIVVTDIAPVMPALKRNLKTNKPVLGKSLKYSTLYWNNSDQTKALNPPFDFVIATDVVYIEESVGQLVSAMEALLADNGVVLLGYQIRCPESHKLFWELCEQVFAIDKVPHDHLHPDAREPRGRKNRKLLFHMRTKLLHTSPPFQKVMVFLIKVRSSPWWVKLNWMLWPMRQHNPKSRVYRRKSILRLR